VNDEPQLQTQRLLLRRWREGDLPALARMNADPLVMEHFPAPLSEAESADQLRRLELSFRRHGIGFWAVDIKGGEPLIGFVGLSPVDPTLPFAPATEIGWRLARKHWGIGLAYEAACASLEYGFRSLELQEIVSFTTVENSRSRRLMERLGMTYDSTADFLHPQLDPADPIAPHVLYRLSVGCWEAKQS
jgi:RimJ/RimL family protein N-acetyltransferase